MAAKRFTFLSDYVICQRFQRHNSVFLLLLFLIWYSVCFILTMSFLFKSFRYLFCIFRPRRKSLLESFSDLTSRMFRKPSIDEPDFLKPSLVEPNCNEHEPSKDRQPFMQFVTRSRVSRTAIWNCTYWLTLFIISNDCCKNSYFAYFMYYLLCKIYTHIL